MAELVARTFGPEIEAARRWELPIGDTVWTVAGSTVVLITREEEDSWTVLLTTPSDPRCLAARGWGRMHRMQGG
jgi:hypothetical protein